MKTKTCPSKLSSVSGLDQEPIKWVKGEFLYEGKGKSIYAV